MRRLALPFALAFLLVIAPIARADDRDPRCADWEQHGVPPGVNMAVMCPGGGLALGDVPLADEPLMPYIVGLLVMAVVLGGFGIVAARVVGKPRAALRAKDFWTCAACGTANGPHRSACFSCQTVRTAPSASGSPPRT